MLAHRDHTCCVCLVSRVITSHPYARLDTQSLMLIPMIVILMLMRCIVLQSVAVCCSVLQCVEVCCIVLHQLVDALHCVALCCSVWQCVSGILTLITIIIIPLFVSLPCSPSHTQLTTLLHTYIYSRVFRVCPPPPPPLHPLTHTLHTTDTPLTHT